MNNSLSRRHFLMTSLAAAATPTWVWGQNADITESSQQWFDVRDWGVEGKGWSETAKFYDRLPAKAEGVVRPAVWSLSRHSAGMAVRFRTDATAIWADYAVTSPRLEMPHMPATGVSGLDLYGQTDSGDWRWISVVKPTQQHMNVNIISGLLPGERNYMIYLPLYNGTESLKIGVPASSTFEPLAPREEKPLLFYGTSITHGACASRPGMPHPAILGRRLDRPVINLGFSGNGKMEPEVGELLAELDPAVYVIDCLPNMVEQEVAERGENLIRQLRQARPSTPIIMVEDRTYSNAPFLPRQQARHLGSRSAYQQAYQALKQGGVQKLFYVEGETLLGEDRDDTTDGSHPSDLGFFRQADALEPVLREALSA